MLGSRYRCGWNPSHLALLSRTNKLQQYRRAPESTDAVYAVSVIPGSLRPEKKNWKIKQIVRKFQNDRQARTGRNMVKPSSPNTPSTWLIFLYLHIHTSAQNLPPADSVLAVHISRRVIAVIVLRKPYLSIKLYRTYVCYTNITL
jgi:hypothetical protein